LVYSTDGGRVNELRPVVKGKRADPKQAAAPPNDGIVRIARDSRGRHGKTATTITGLPGDDAVLDALLKQLKQACGAGGSRDGRVLEIQGDHRERLRDALSAMGHTVKLAGG
jgi:translation initiation factor 1